MTNLYDAVAGCGLNLLASATRNRDAASKLFNGVTYATLNNGADPGERVLFQPPKDGVNPSTTVTIPEAFEPGKRVVLRRVDIYPVTYWSSAKTRMPTEYKVIGIDEYGIEHELAHPTGLTYPNLAENANRGEHYDVTITDAAAEFGYRVYKIEFLNSAGWASNSYPISCMEINLQVELLPEDPLQREFYGILDFGALLRSGGYSMYRGGRSECVYEQNCWCTAVNLFDGLTFHIVGSGDNFRWLGYLERTGGCYAEIRAPAAFRPGDFFVLKNCRPWCLSYNSNEIARGPTEWRLFGVDNPDDDAVWKAADDSAWSEIEHVSGVSWSGISFNKSGMNTIGMRSVPLTGKGYRAFRFRPLNSAYHEVGTDKIDIGLSELELRVIPVNQRGSLRVRTNRIGCDLAGGSHLDGALVTEATTVTAPEIVRSAQTACRVKGYRVETFDYEKGAWNVGSSVAALSYDYTPDAEVSVRLIWELEDIGVRIDASLDDAGRETVTYEPSGPYYAAGAVVTLTANPNNGILEAAAGATNVYRSAFVRWEGDTNGLADVTSPVITVTVGSEPIKLTPVFRRDWLIYRYDRANEGGSGMEWRLTDGNFDITCDGDQIMAGTLYNAWGVQWLKAGRGAMDLSTKFVRADTGAEVKLTRIEMQSLTSDNTQPRADLSRVVLPRTLEEINGGPFRDQTNLVEAVIDCPVLTKINSYIFARDSYLDRVVFKAPKLQQFTGSYAFFKARMDETDVTEWNLESLRTMSSGSDRFSLAEWGTTHGFRGTLTLPRIETISKLDFYCQTYVTNVVLGSARGSLKSIGENAFSFDAGIRSLTIGCGTDLDVNTNAFNNCTSLEEVVLLKHIPSVAALDAILKSATADRRARLYVSSMRPLPDGFLQPLDPAQDAKAPDDAAGVYVTAKGERKAWVLYRNSPLDPKGSIIYLR